MKSNTIKKTQVCGGCVHFHQHYVKWEGRYREIAYGHCDYPRLKDRMDSDTCPNWQPVSQTEEPQDEAQSCPAAAQTR